MTTTEPYSIGLRQLRAHPEYFLMTVGAVVGYLLGSIEGVVLGAVMGFFIGKTIQSLIWAFVSE